VSPRRCLPKVLGTSEKENFKKWMGASAVPVVLLAAALDVDGLAGAGRKARHIVGRVLVLQVLVVRGLLPAQVPVVRGLVAA